MHNPQRQSHLIFAMLLATLLILPILGLLAGPSAGAENPSADRSTADQIQDSWKTGLIEGAYLFNTHLNNFDITTEVTGDTAVLKGAVNTSAERALAEQLALSVEGINKVDNKLTVNDEVKKNDASKSADTTATILTPGGDAAITTKVKSQLLANTETSGLDIKVETRNRVVTLTGNIENDVEKELAYYVTRNTGGVQRVINQLEIRP